MKKAIIKLIVCAKIFKGTEKNVMKKVTQNQASNPPASISFLPQHQMSPHAQSTSTNSTLLGWNHRKSITVAHRVSTYRSYRQIGEFLALLLTSISTECIDIRAAVLPPATDNVHTSVLPFYSNCMLTGAHNLN